MTTSASERAEQDPIVGGLPDVPGHRRRDAPDARARRPPARPRGRAARQRLPGRDAPARRARDARDRRVRGERLLLLHGLARRVRDGPAGARAARPSTCRSIDVIKTGSSDGLDAEDARAPPHRADASAATRSQPDRGRCRRRRIDAGRHRRGRPARGAHRRRRSRCTTGWSTASGRTRRLPRRPTPSARLRSPSSATAPRGRPQPLPSGLREGGDPGFAVSSVTPGLSRPSPWPGRAQQERRQVSRDVREGQHVRVQLDAERLGHERATRLRCVATRRGNGARARRAATRRPARCRPRCWW